MASFRLLGLSGSAKKPLRIASLRSFSRLTLSCSSSQSLKFLLSHFIWPFIPASIARSLSLCSLRHPHFRSIANSDLSSSSDLWLKSLLLLQNWIFHAWRCLWVYHSDSRLIWRHEVRKKMDWLPSCQSYFGLHLAFVMYPVNVLRVNVLYLHLDLVDLEVPT